MKLTNEILYLAVISFSLGMFLGGVITRKEINNKRKL